MSRERAGSDDPDELGDESGQDSVPDWRHLLPTLVPGDVKNVPAVMRVYKTLTCYAGT
jgi:hypothetical protein